MGKHGKVYEGVWAAPNRLFNDFRFIAVSHLKLKTLLRNPGNLISIANTLNYIQRFIFTVSHNLLTLLILSISGKTK